MASVTTTLDTTYNRVGVNLSGWSADGVVPVYRVHADGSRNLVRGMSAVSGGVAFGWDYEAPLSQSIYYQALDGSYVYSPATTLTVPGVESMLTVPGLPSFGGPVLLARRPVFDRARSVATMRPIGRTVPIVKSDVPQAPSFTLALATYSDAEAYSLLSTLEVAPVLLLRVPGSRVIDWCYVSTGRIAEAPVSPLLPPKVPVGSIPETWAAWEIECQVVDAPVGGVFGDPTATYQASLDAYPTYTDRLNAHATYI
ncbi:MAG: hypothetical protein HOQ27_10315, partial [Dermatophilaceae bacterium]|nr:hypothetical protein [Dermatophilaceae bacterium]